MKLLFVALCSVLLLLNAAHAVGSPRRRYSLFVFGDEYADAGNYPRSVLSSSTRAWYWPYGSDDYDHGKGATGRFSNGLVLSDFIARVLGGKESPPPERTRAQNSVDPSGVNLAVGGAGVITAEGSVPELGLGTQIQKFRRLVKHGVIDNEYLSHSVALIAFSGKRDYAGVLNLASSGIEARAREVTDEIAGAVERLTKLGVRKMLVTTLPPLGCTPWLSRPSGYNSSCDGQKVAGVHNAYLKEKVFKNQAVFNLDLHAAFTHLAVDQNPGTRSNRFKYRLEPCCVSFDQDGYCGQEKQGAGEQYAVCAEPDIHFYWEDVSPTHAGWKAVVEVLQQSIQNFLPL